jgi:ATP-dependent DNA helicase RecG
VPNYAPQAFREAVNNAVLHRDYTRRGATHVQWHSDHLFISNPGGFLEGITLDNLLVHEPKPRNPRLTEAARRIGLVETTGRGIDKIYLGLKQAC